MSRARSGHKAAMFRNLQYGVADPLDAMTLDELVTAEGILATKAWKPETIKAKLKEA